MSKLVKIFGLAFSLCLFSLSSLWGNIRYFPDRQSVQCFIVEKNGRNFLFSEGVVFEVKQSGQRERLGRTRGGCIVVDKVASPNAIKVLQFHPDKKNSGPEFYEFRAQINQNNNFNLRQDNNEICFLSQRGGRKFYYFSFSKGKVIEEGKVIATTDKSCFTIDSNMCKRRTTLQFQPDGLARFNQFMTFRNVNTCESRDIIIDRRALDHYSKFANSVPYVENVDLTSSYFKDLARELTKDCEKSDRECQIFNIYQYVTKNFRYIHDRIGIDGKDQIIPPLETIKRGGGDCEDLTALLNSILSAAEIENYVVLTSDHAYSLVCGLNVEKMTQLVTNGLIKENVDKRRVRLRAGSYQVLSTTFFNTLPKQSRINLTSNSPIDFYFTQSDRDARNVFRDRPIKTIDNCFRKNTNSFTATCTTNGRAVYFLIYNPLKQTATVNFSATTSYFAFRGQTPKLSSVKHNGKECLLLESTLDDDGYPGFANQKGRSNLAINVKSWEWFIF